MRFALAAAGCVAIAGYGLVYDDGYPVLGMAGAAYMFNEALDWRKKRRKAALEKDMAIAPAPAS